MNVHFEAVRVLLHRIRCGASSPFEVSCLPVRSRWGDGNRVTDFPLPHPGPWLTSQLVERFGTPRVPKRLVRDDVLVQISRGMFYRADSWASLPPDERHLVLLAAHHEFHKALGTSGFAYSHLSAARLHGIELWAPDELIHLTLPRSIRSGAHRPEVRVHTARLNPSDLCDVRGLPTTRLENTVIDCARYLRRGQAQIVVDHGLRLGADRKRLDELDWMNPTIEELSAAAAAE